MIRNSDTYSVVTVGAVQKSLIYRDMFAHHTDSFGVKEKQMKVSFNKSEKIIDK